MILTARWCVGAAKNRPGSAMSFTPRDGGKCTASASRSARAIPRKVTSVESTPGKPARPGWKRELSFCKNPVRVHTEKEKLWRCSPPPTSRTVIGSPRCCARSKTAAARATASRKASTDDDPEPTWNETPATRKPRRDATARSAAASFGCAPYLLDRTHCGQNQFGVGDMLSESAGTVSGAARLPGDVTWAAESSTASRSSKWQDGCSFAI